MNNKNGAARLAERLMSVLERLADPKVLLTAMIVAGIFFYYDQFLDHDRKLDALLEWTSRKTAFDLVNCVRESEDEGMVRVCEQASRGEVVDVSKIRRRWQRTTP